MEAEAARQTITDLHHSCHYWSNRVLVYM